MKTIIIISRCLKTKKNSSNTYSFHFKGVYMGVQVNSLELMSEKDFKRGQDYVMRVKVHSLDHFGVLKGAIIFSRNLDEITSH